MSGVEEEGGGQTDRHETEVVMGGGTDRERERERGKLEGRKREGPSIIFTGTNTSPRHQDGRLAVACVIAVSAQ